MDEKEEEKTLHKYPRVIESETSLLNQELACRQLSKLNFDRLIKKVLDKAASDCWVPVPTCLPDLNI